MNARRRLALAVVITAATAMLAGCAGSSPNATACKLYEDAYNQMMDMAKAKNNGAGVTASDVTAETQMLPSRIADAFAKASGDVAVQMRDSRDAASVWIADSSQDSGVAFFMSATTVQKACKSDGASISLHAGR